MRDFAAATATAATVSVLCLLIMQSKICNAENLFLEQLWEESFKLNHTSALHFHEFEELLHRLRLGEKQKVNCTAAAGHDDHSGHDHSGHDHRRRRRSVGHSEEFEKIEACLNSSTIASVLNITTGTDLTQSQFTSLSLAIVQQLNGRFCEPAPAATTGSVKPDSGLTYLYGSISVLIISILSTIGCLFAVCSSTKGFKLLLLFLIELAVGALVGEALLHLLPTVIEGSHDHSGKTIPPSFFRLLVACGTLWVLHFFDTLSMVTGHGHSHHKPPVKSTDFTGLENMTQEQQQQQQQHQQQQQQVDEDSSGTESIERAVAHPRIKLITLMKKPKLWLRSPYRMCAIILLGDALHNFADGLAIGAGYAVSHGDGLKLSLTIGLHELAHELADFAILLSCGFSVPAAALLNFVSALTAFIGLYVAIPLTQASAEVKIWILAITAIVFIYIALVSMSSMVREAYTANNYKAFFLGNAGLFTGFVLIVIVTIAEFLI